MKQIVYLEIHYQQVNRMSVNYQNYQSILKHLTQ